MPPYEWDMECVVCGHQWVDDGVLACPECERDTTYSFNDLLVFAYEAHEGQIYYGRGVRQDEPYICHPIRVAAKVSGTLAKSVAILHDCLEDAGRLPAGLPIEIRGPLEYLTRKEDQTYEEYIEAIVNAPGEAGTLACAVKYTDLLDNITNSDRPPEKYYEAIQTILVSGRNISNYFPHPEKEQT